MSRYGIIGPYDTDDFRAHFYWHLVVYDTVSEAYYGMPYANIYHPILPSGYSFSPSQIQDQCREFRCEGYHRHATKFKEDTRCERENQKRKKLAILISIESTAQPEVATEDSKMTPMKRK